MRRSSLMVLALLVLSRSPAWAAPKPAHPFLDFDFEASECTSGWSLGVAASSGPSTARPCTRAGRACAWSTWERARGARTSSRSACGLSRQPNSRAGTSGSPAGSAPRTSTSPPARQSPGAAPASKSRWRRRPGASTSTSRAGVTPTSPASPVRTWTGPSRTPASCCRASSTSPAPRAAQRAQTEAHVAPEVVDPGGGGLGHGMALHVFYERELRGGGGDVSGLRPDGSRYTHPS